MSIRVFLSYRRSDAESDAGRIYDAIKIQRPSWTVFIDVEEVTPGATYTTDIQRLIRSCDVLLAVIGPSWLTASDERSGLRRLQDPGDLLRLEVVTALDSGLVVAPVLVRGAKVPRSSEVPAALTPLVVLHATALRHTSFSNDVGQLVDGLDRSVADRRQNSPMRQQSAEPRWDPTTMPSVKRLQSSLKTASFELALFEGADPTRLKIDGRTMGDPPWFTIDGQPIRAFKPARDHPLRRGTVGEFWFTSPDGIEHRVWVYVRHPHRNTGVIVGMQVGCDERVLYQWGLT